MGGIYVDFSVVNQLNSPALNSNTFANRPAAGQIGRLFISTDTFEIYRDNGTTWDLIGGPGTSTITGTGTPGTMPVFTAAQAIGDSSLIEGSTKFTTTKDFQADAIYLNSMTAGSGALYYSGNRLTLANYNPGGDVMIEANGGAFAQFISGTDLSTTFYGNIIRNGGLSTQFLKADGSLDSSTYLTSNIYTADGTLAAARTVNLNNHNLRFEGGANTARVRLSANNNVARIFSFATADVARWAFRIDGNETGSNAGANFALRRYNDAGAFIDAPIVVNRATGHVGIGPGLQQLETFNVTGSSLFSHSYTQGNDFNRKGVFAFLNTTTNSGAAFTNGYNYNAITGLHWDNFSANTTIPNGVTIGGTYSGGQVGFDTINTTVTLAQGSGGGLRTFSGSIAQIALAAPTTGGVVTHASGFQALAPYYIGANLPTITNYFGVAINDSTEYSSVAITNRWGIYQNGSTDRNYLNGNVLIGSATDNGNKLQVTGQATISGNVGIGTNNPGARLDVQGGSIINGNGTIQTAITYATMGIVGTLSNHDLSLYTNNAERMRITSGGNVGIGSTSPSVSLVVSNAGAAGFEFNPNSAGLAQLETYNRSTSAYVGFRINADDIRFHTGSGASERMRITSGGNVLVGTTTDAGQKLQVNGGAKIDGLITQGGGIYTATGTFSQGASTTAVFYTFANVNTDQVYIITIRQQAASANSVIGIAFARSGTMAAYNIAQENTNPALFLTITSNGGLGLQLTTGSGYGTTTWEYTITTIK